METIIRNIPNTEIDFKGVMELHGFNGMIPSGYIIDKTIPGIGATKCEITSPRHSIIIAPFTAIIEVKKQQYGEALFDVFGERDTDDVVRELIAYVENEDILYKKIMTTPESFFKIKRGLNVISPNYIEDYFMLVDECDVFVSDAIFRKSMLAFLPDFFSFQYLAMISATPIIPTDVRFREKNFSVMKLKPDFKLNNNLDLIITNNINGSLNEVIDYYSKINDQPFFIFTNCKRTIAYLAKQGKISNDYMVFCSRNLAGDFFLKHSIYNVLTSIDGQYSKFNFLTSRFFSGVDIWLEDDVKPNVIMVSNLEPTPHSIINPGTTAVQIFGRCRKGVSSFTHVTTLVNKESEDVERIKSTIDEQIYHIAELFKIKDKLSLKLHKKLISDVMEKNKGFDMFNKDGVLNSYLRDNYLLSLITENLFTCEKLLCDAYEASKFFNVKSRKVYKAFTEHDILKLTSTKNKKAKSIEVFIQLHKLTEEYGKFNISNVSQDYYNHINELNKTDPLIFEAYFELGAEGLARHKFDRKQIRHAVNLAKSENSKNHLQLIDDIIDSFLLGCKIYLSRIEDVLNAIYERHNCTDKNGRLRKAVGTDIEDYFECKRMNGKKKNQNGKYETYYILHKAKYRHSSEYKK